MKGPGRRIILAAALALAAASCGEGSADSSRDVQQSVLNGDDDRKEVFEIADAIRGPLTASSAALFYSNHLRLSAPDSVSLRADPAASALGLCPDEPFANETSAAFCSGVLIDDDLMATAGHCMGTDAASAAQRCARIQIAFGYWLPGAGEPVSLRPEQVFSCRRVVTFESETFAVLQLDRPALLPLAPATLATRGAQVGDGLVVATYGAGLPLKVEVQARVTAVSIDSSTLTAAMDTFSGSSGGGLFTQELALVGLVERGESDWEQIDGCERSRHSATPAEEGQQAIHLPDEVCAANWPSERLCGTLPVCGDGLCNASERGSCPSDCPPPRCGDRVCEPAEWGSCAADCARYDAVPSNWLDDPEIYLSMAASLGSGTGSAVAPSGGGCSYSNPVSNGFESWSLALLLPMLLSRFKRAPRQGSVRTGSKGRPLSASARECEGHVAESDRLGRLIRAVYCRRKLSNTASRKKSCTCTSTSSRTV